MSNKPKMEKKLIANFKIPKKNNSANIVPERLRKINKEKDLKDELYNSSLLEKQKEKLSYGGRYNEISGRPKSSSDFKKRSRSHSRSPRHLSPEPKRHQASRFHKRSPSYENRPTLLDKPKERPPPVHYNKVSVQLKASSDVKKWSHSHSRSPSHHSQVNLQSHLSSQEAKRPPNHPSILEKHKEKPSSGVRSGGTSWDFKKWSQSHRSPTHHSQVSHQSGLLPEPKRHQESRQSPYENCPSLLEKGKEKPSSGVRYNEIPGWDFKRWSRDQSRPTHYENRTHFPSPSGMSTDEYIKAMLKRLDELEREDLERMKERGWTNTTWPGKHQINNGTGGPPSYNGRSGSTPIQGLTYEDLQELLASQNSKLSSSSSEKFSEENSLIPDVMTTVNVESKSANKSDTKSEGQNRKSKSTISDKKSTDSLKSANIKSKLPGSSLGVKITVPQQHHVRPLVMHARQCWDADCHRRSCHKLKKVFQHRKLCRKRKQGICPICNGWLPFNSKTRWKFQEQKQVQRYQASRIKKLRMSIMNRRKTSSNPLPQNECSPMPNFPCKCGPSQNVIIDSNTVPQASHQMPSASNNHTMMELQNEYISKLVEFMFPGPIVDPAHKQNLKNELIKLFEIIEKENQLLAENREIIERKETECNSL